jgi:hypothetical protein
LADEPHAASRNIATAAERIEHLAASAAVERVDREIAPPRVCRPVVGEGDGGMAAVRLHVLAQRRHLMGNTAGDHGHRAVRETGRVGRKARSSRRRNHRLWMRWGGDIDIDHGTAQQRIAHSAADGTRRVASRGKRIKYGARVGSDEPVGASKAWQLGGRWIGHPATTSVGRARCARPCPHAEGCRLGRAYHQA